MPFGMRPALSLLRFATEFPIVLQPTVLKLCVCVQTLTDTITRTLRIAHVPTSGHLAGVHAGTSLGIGQHAGRPLEPRQTPWEACKRNNPALPPST